jgi:hypothetical protein
MTALFDDSTMERHFIVFGSADSLTAFADAASEAGIPIERRDVQAFSAEQTAIECLRLMAASGGMLAIASVIKAFLVARPSRRITITQLEHDRVISVDARQLSKRELLELLPKCRELVVSADDEATKET